MEASERSPSASGDNSDPSRSSTRDADKESAVERDGATQSPGQSPEASKPPSRLKQAWDKVGLDPMTLIIMFKGSLPPTIAIAAFQSSAWARHFTTLGYLVAIASILGFCIMPRGKFLQTMSLNVIGVCLGAATNLLALFCVTQARLHTTPANQPLRGYNSSASAVSGIWLFVQLYLVNTIRAARPQFQFPCIIYSIFSNVSMVYGVELGTMASAISFMTRLLEAFLAGFAIATGVSFFIFPTSSRKVVFKEITGYLMSMNGVLKTQTAYIQSLEDFDPVKARQKREEDSKNQGKKQKGPTPGPLTTPAGMKMKEVVGKALELHTKLHGDITPAKREFALGKLESHDLTELWKLLRLFFVPVIGLASSMSLMEQLAAEQDWAHVAEAPDEKQAKQRQVESLHFLMKQLSGPFVTMTGHMTEAVTHILLVLELQKPPKKKEGDEESGGEEAAPGTPAFAAAYREKVDAFYSEKELTLRDWCKEHDIELPDDFFDSTFVHSEKLLIDDKGKREKFQRQLFFMLFQEYLLWRAALALFDIVLWADKKRQEGALQRAKLIFPGSKTLYKWLYAVFGQEDLSNDGHYLAEMGAGGAESLFLGANFARAKDPEHLPPQNIIERFGEKLRYIPRFFRSDSSAFGLRAAVATFTVAIINFLHPSQNFFLKQRLLWAMIMIAISMNRMAGQSIFNFALRVLGTAVSMVACYIIWYIVDGRVAGVIVFLWLWIFIAFYGVVKFPKLVVVFILSLVTAVLIIGYELQVKALGVKLSESNGQPAYPTYELAPYRLATVVGGLFVAFIWTVFPYPVGESTELRKDLGASLYLLSNFYSVIHETIRARILGTDGDEKVKGSHAYHLEKARNAVFSKLMLLLQNMKMNAEFSKSQIRIGGKFPRADYESLIESCQRVLQYSALMGYASATFSVHQQRSHPDTGNELSEWSHDFRELAGKTSHTSHAITSILALLSSCLSHGQALPPYLELPKPFQIVKEIETIDPDLLSVRHIAQPEYSAFAVLQVCSVTVSKEIEKIVEHVRNLVGEVDFSFHPARTSESSGDSGPDSAEERKDKAE